MLAIFLTAGYPNYQATLKALQILNEEKIDLIELGVPYSDPLADGPVIQKSSHEALQQGMNLDKVFDLVAEARVGIPSSPTGSGNLILFSYYNPIFAYGIDKFINKCLANGVKGALIPDLPVDEAKELSALFKSKGLGLTLLAAVTSTDTRLEAISKYSEPFIYLVSRVGITGSGGSNNVDLLKTIIAKLKKFSSKPIGLGFGIDSPKKVQEAFDMGADMAIIGSQAIKILETDDSELSGFRAFIKEISAVKSSQPA